MFKYAALVIFAFAAIANADPWTDPCEPRSVFFYECNRCICLSSGKGAACTRMRCEPGEYNSDGTLKKPSVQPIKAYASNDADVNEESDTFQPYNPLPELPEGPCVPGESYKKVCNFCICGKSGVPFCSLKQCFASSPSSSSSSDAQSFSWPPFIHTIEPLKSADEWGPVYKHGDSCVPGSTFFSECNTCVCGKNGRSAGCTFQLCIPELKQ